MKPTLRHLVVLGCSLGLWAAACSPAPEAEPEKTPASPTVVESHAPSVDPPAGLAPSEVPMMVGFGWDDNAYEDGMQWVLGLAEGRRNPQGQGNPKTFDGRPISMSFYFTSDYAEGQELRDLWRRAYDGGHEVGVHTQTHTTNVTTTLDEWRREIAGCLQLLTEGLGIPRSEIVGFRTPYLEHNSATFTALKEHGLTYDCSLEEGFDATLDGTNFLWPYTLDHGSPGNEILVAQGRKQAVGRHPGLWEMPAYAVVVPPDDRCEAYGLEPGLRDRLSKIQKYFQPEDGKITGFDYNLWYLFHLTREEVVAILKYTLDQRLAGNRAPLLIGTHSEEYSQASEPALGSDYLERRKAVEEFLDYALSHPSVRVVSSREILNWIRNPSPLTPRTP